MAHLENAASVDNTEKDLDSSVACLILTSDGVESMLKIIKVLTEQPPCCQLEQPTDCVRIIAYAAGTGKTTTLLKYCQARPDKRFLVLIFNNSAAVDAKKRLPPNAMCCTIQSWAYGKEGSDNNEIARPERRRRLRNET